MRIRSLSALLVAAALVFASCGDSDDGGDATPSDTSGGAAPSTTAAAPSSAAPSTDAGDSGGAPTCAGLAEPDPAAADVAVDLVEWEITTDAEIPAGGATVTITNTANGTHEFLVVQGESFESLPKLSNGAVDEDALGAGAIVTRTERLDGNTSCATNVDLTPGNYVLLCNINSGPNSHAAKGQRLDITVS